MMRARLPVLALVAPLLFAGCASMDDLPPPSGDHGPFYPATPEPPVVSTGGIYRSAQGDNLLGRARRFQVGDVLTVLLNESTQAARAATANVSREASNDVVPPGLTSRIGNMSKLLDGVNLNKATIDSKGTGTADQRASLSGSVTVTVVEVLSNGNLVVKGEKHMQLTQGTEVIQVSGIVRTDDIAPNNTVQSRRLANARFAYQGGGELATATRAGWGTRGLMKFWPF